MIPPIDEETIGTRISRARQKIPAFTDDQEALGKCVGVSRQTVSNWETDTHPPRDKHLKQLAECLDVSVAWIRFGIDDEASTADPSNGQFAVRLGLALSSARISQAELSEALGVQQATVSDWCIGKALPAGSSMARLPELLSVSGHWLLTGDGPMHADPSEDSVRLQVIGKLADGSLTMEEVGALAQSYAATLPTRSINREKRKDGS